jgi:hypothetical protein
LNRYTRLHKDKDIIIPSDRVLRALTREVLISQGRVGGNNIAGAKSDAKVNVTAQETKFHAFVDTLKQNALLFLRQFGMSK